ncbi:methyltransferase [Candidatus Bathyarchaeota archaeon]|nr:MAG: methyltransferase [Candidatus Bathyarchaeota archaeon]
MIEGKRTLSKRQLEIRLGKLKILESPRLKLEQYPVSPEVAAELLYMAGFEHDDLHGKKIAELGTGTGRLAIGAALMGAQSVLGVDVDERALVLARENAAGLGAVVDWANRSMEDVKGEFDTVIMNPPYGTRLRHHDVKFLLKGFQLAPVTYSIHKSSTRDFLSELIKKHGRRVDEIRSMRMVIPHLFSFHKRKWAGIDVDVYRTMA